jgi:glycosyltransferase involved in cell wall biosynthesis
LAEQLGLGGSLIWNEAREDMPAVYNALDIVVSSSYSEGLSNVIGEAMACGVPCVVTNVGDSAWVVGDTGEVVPPKDPVALKNAIERLLDQKAYGPDQIRQGIVDRLSVSNLIVNTERTLNALVTDRVSEVRPVKAFQRPRVNP